MTSLQGAWSSGSDPIKTLGKGGSRERQSSTPSTSSWTRNTWPRCAGQVGFLMLSPRICLACPPISGLWQAGRRRAEQALLGTGLPGGRGEEGRGSLHPVLLPYVRIRVGHPPFQGGGGQERTVEDTAGVWKKRLPWSPNPVKWPPPSCGVVPVWLCVRSQKLEKQKDLDAEWHLCSQRACGQPRPGQ